MKRTMSRSIVSLILAAAFMLGLGFLCFKYIRDGAVWANQVYNQHQTADAAGAIYDRNGEALAETLNGERVYHEDYNVRLGTMHCVADESFNILTAVQSAKRAKLHGYSGLLGYSLPGELNKQKDIKLTLDAEVCGKVYEAFGDKKGACVVYNYKTGEVICMVSAPSFDPQNVPENPPDGSYYNNVVSSTYTPGSIFKIITTIALIESGENVDEMRFTCDGVHDFGGDDVSCMDEEHGEIGIYTAFSRSCNIAFAEAATRLGAEKLQETATRLGVTKSFSVSSVKTAAGNFDLSDANLNELAWSGVGQYTDMVNPMQMAILCGAVANGGKASEPYYIDSSVTHSDVELMSAETADKMQDIMRYTVENYYGDYLFSGLTCGAKTGTAEVGKDKEPNAWMVGYCSDEEYPLAFAVVVEEGGLGYQSAGPIASLALTESARSLGYEGY
ncbi:MAG: penicillin-binding protein [Ruminococcus sp.]|nr:penicillin-binding protein [Ruminococcus sp.]